MKRFDRLYAEIKEEPQKNKVKQILFQYFVPIYLLKDMVLSFFICFAIDSGHAQIGICMVLSILLTVTNIWLRPFKLKRANFMFCGV